MPEQLSRVHPVVSTQLIKPYKQRAGGDLPPVVINSELEYEVDAILDFQYSSRGAKESVTLLNFGLNGRVLVMILGMSPSILSIVKMC
jgi:hypothetical protein